MMNKSRIGGRCNIFNHYFWKVTDQFLDTDAFFDLSKKQKPLKLKQMENNCSEFEADDANH